MSEATASPKWALVVDRERCELSGYCTHTASSLVRISEADELVIDHFPLKPHEVDEARGAVAVCPFRALALNEWLEEDDDAHPPATVSRGPLSEGEQ